MGDFAVLAKPPTINNAPWVYSVVLAMGLANIVMLVFFARRDRTEARLRRERLLGMQLGTALRENGRTEEILAALEGNLDSLDSYIADRLAAASSLIQRHARGQHARRVALDLQATVDVVGNSPGEPRARARRAREHALTKFVRASLSRMLEEHSVLGLWYGNPEKSSRAELCQTLYAARRNAIRVSRCPDAAQVAAWLDCKVTAAQSKWSWYSP